MLTKSVCLTCLFLHTEASIFHKNNIFSDIDEVEMMKIKTEPIQFDGLNSVSEYANMVDINSDEFVTERK